MAGVRGSPMNITKHGRYWAVLDADGTLVCITLYKKGAQEVVNRLMKAVGGNPDGERPVPQAQHRGERSVFKYGAKF